MLTDGPHLPTGILIKDKLKLFPSSEVPAAKDQKLFSPFFFLSRPGQRGPLHRARSPGEPLNLAATSRQPGGVRSLDSLPDLQMGSQSQPHSLLQGQAESLWPTCELQRGPKKRSCLRASRGRCARRAHYVERPNSETHSLLGGKGCLQTSSKLTLQEQNPRGGRPLYCQPPKEQRKIGQAAQNQLDWFYREASGLLRLPYVKKKKMAWSQPLNTPLRCSSPTPIVP